ncbi:MAG TPA: hypothetical protein VFS19_06320 [Planctomycetota bacterium]|nr:hypothetical protein [Planctomycetota bacterium]
MKRMACAGLSTCLLLSSAGCQSGAERAGLHRQLVEVGMTRDEVEVRLGEPDGWEENVSGYEVWAYSYRPNAGTFIVWRTVDAVELTVKVALVLTLFVGLVALSRGGLTHYPDLSPSWGPQENPPRGGAYQRFVFRIGFNPETGRVAYVSSPLPE